MAINRSWHPSPNYSSRGGSGVRLITVHTSEGATTNQSLANFICQASAQVSYHISVDNEKSNFCYEYVQRGNKAWAQANYNPMAVTGCFCTPTGASGGWSRSYWLNNMDRAISNMAAWVAEEAAHYGIPLVALNNSQAQGSGRGVCQHVNLGAGGSGHYDCGDGFPMDELIRRAKGGGPSPTPETSPYTGAGMSAITQSPCIVPVPGMGVHKIRLGSDVGGQGCDSISVRVARHKGGQSNSWKVDNLSITDGNPRPELDLDGYDVVRMDVTGDYAVGYEWA